MARRAFSLIELLVVVAIIALLMGILLPALKQARDRTRDQICRLNMGQVVRGFLLYAAENLDQLPGGKCDSYETAAGQTVTADWLGVGTNKEWSRAPQEGTIFRYVRNERAYQCPTHLLANEARDGEDWPIEHRISYTAPVELSGAPIPLFKLTRYPDEPPDNDQSPFPTRESAANHMLPIVMAEEDTNWLLVKSRDSSWVTVDQFTARHRGAGGIGFIDGHTELRALTKIIKRFKGPLSAWNLLYELTDGRVVSVGHAGRAVQFGWIRHAPTDR